VRAFNVGRVSSARPLTRTAAAVVESITFDDVGKLQWDVHALPDASHNAGRILEGYTLRPNQVSTCWIWTWIGMQL
jgi:hypothetical protein